MHESPDVADFKRYGNCASCFIRKLERIYPVRFPWREKRDVIDLALRRSVDDSEVLSAVARFRFAVEGMDV